MTHADEDMRHETRQALDDLERMTRDFRNLILASGGLFTLRIRRSIVRLCEAVDSLHRRVTRLERGD